MPEANCYMYWKESNPCWWYCVSEIRATLLTSEEARSNGAGYARFLRSLDREEYQYRPTTVRVVTEKEERHCYGVTVGGQPVIEVLNWGGGSSRPDQMIKRLAFYVQGTGNGWRELGGPPYTDAEKAGYSYVFWTRSTSADDRYTLDRRRQTKYTRLWTAVTQSMAARQMEVVPLLFVPTGDPVPLDERLGTEPLG